MTLRVAVQMDPLETINIVGDSSFALMLSAQNRGHEVFHYDVGSLTLDADDRLIAQARPVRVQPVVPEADPEPDGHPVQRDRDEQIRPREKEQRGNRSDMECDHDQCGQIIQRCRVVRKTF